MKASEIQTAVLDRGRRLRDELAAVPGLKLRQGHRGVYEYGGTKIHAFFEGADSIALRVPLPAPPAPAEALAAASSLVGNLRFARVEHRVALVADTLLDGVAHLSETLAEVALSAKGVLDGDSRVGSDGAEVSVERVDEAVAGLGWPEDAVVRQEEGWELRPRLQLHRNTAALPVRLTRERSGLRVHRVLLRSRPDESERPAGPALAELALQLNGRIRLARLAVHGRSLVAEARLRDELVTPAWLGETVRAVAAASGCCQTPVRILTNEHRVAEVFLAASAPSATRLPRET